MSYSPEDSAWDEAYESMSRELYPGHKAQAIVEFSYERLRSFYAKTPDVLVPAVRNFKQATSLYESGQHGAAVVFSASATELFLKGALLRPVVYGLVHSEALAELVVEAALAQTGFKRYQALLAGLFREISHFDIGTLTREGSNIPLLAEASKLQEERNGVMHRGDEVSREQAESAVAVASAVFGQIVANVLWELGFSVQKGGHLVDAER